MADVFAIQEEVGLAIVNTLEANLTVPERSAIQSAPTQNLEAYQLYLRSGALNSTSPDENARAIRMLEQALVLDPAFTQAKLAIAHRHQWMAMLGDETHSAKARQLANEVLEQDPASSDALYLLATAAFSGGHVRESRVWFDRALEVDPDHHDALVDKGYLQTETGQLADGLDLSSRGLLSALNTANARFHVAWPLLALADDSRTRRWLDVAALDVPAFSRLDLSRIALEFRSGNADEARRLALAGLTRWAGVNEFEVFASDALHLLGDIENARAALQMSARQSPDAKPYAVLSKRSPRLTFALILEQSGDQTGAADLMAAAHASAEKAIAAGNEWAYPHMDLATISIVRGETVDAVTALERARASGYRDFRTLRLDPVFEPLHGNVRFETLLAEMEKHTSAERARAQARGYNQIVDEIISAAESTVTD